MYLAHVRAENFRIFGSAPQRRGDGDDSLRIDFGPGISVLVGENDSGKTAIVDAIRLCLLTRRLTSTASHATNVQRLRSASTSCP